MQGLGPGPQDHPAGRHLYPSTATSPSGNPSMEGAGHGTGVAQTLVQIPALHHTSRSSGGRSFISSVPQSPQLCTGMRAVTLSQGGCEDRASHCTKST